jgi:putative peptide zinc metalloprotease protein
MIRRGRWPVAALAVLACAAPGSAIGQSDLRKQDNVAVAVAEQDGARAFDFSWEVIRQRRGAVDSRNVANAAARCTDCRATAIAFQVVLAWGDPGEVSPHNQAVAINDQCTRCVVYAGARQFVRVVDEPARFTGAGRSTLADVRNELRAIEGQDLTVDEQVAIVEAQEARVLDVLLHEVVPTAGEGKAMVEDRNDREADDD